MPAWILAGLIALAGLLGPVTAEAGYRGPFEGRVVDAETLQPIQGAVVFVEWMRSHITVAGDVPKFYDAAEVLTDETGHFRIKKKWSLNPWTNWMLGANVVIYKAGYREFHLYDKWGRMDELVEEHRAYSLKKGQRVPNDVDWQLEYEDGRALVLLKKITTAKDVVKNLPFVGADVPEAKMKLLEEERTRELKAFGLED